MFKDLEQKKPLKYADATLHVSGVALAQTQWSCAGIQPGGKGKAS